MSKNIPLHVILNPPIDITVAAWMYTGFINNFFQVFVLHKTPSASKVVIGTFTLLGLVIVLLTFTLKTVGATYPSSCRTTISLWRFFNCALNLLFQICSWPRWIHRWPTVFSNLSQTCRVWSSSLTFDLWNRTNTICVYVIFTNNKLKVTSQHTNLGFKIIMISKIYRKGKTLFLQS